MKEREQDLQVREQAFQDRDWALQEKTDLQKALDGEKDKNTQLTKERDNLKSKAGDLQNSNRALEQTVENKQLECDKLKEKTGYKSIHVWLRTVMIVKKPFSIVILLIMV